MNQQTDYLPVLETPIPSQHSPVRRVRSLIVASTIVAAVVGISFSLLHSNTSTPRVAIQSQAVPTTAATEPIPTVPLNNASVTLGYLTPGVQFDSTQSNPRKGGLLYDLYTIPGAANLDTAPADSSQYQLGGTQHTKTQLIVSKQSNVSVLPISSASPRFNLVADKTISGQTYRLTTPLSGYGRLTVEWVANNAYYYVGNDQLSTSDGKSGLGIEELLRIAIRAR